MSRPDLPGEPARPTLFGAARGPAHDAPLRMLSPAAPPDGRRFVVRTHRAVAAAVLLAAAGAALTIDALTPRPPARAARATSIPPVVQSASLPAPAAAAPIESIEPVAVPARHAALPTAAAPSAAAPSAAARTSAPSPRAATKPRAAVLPALSPAPADADVDLLAAMVTRLQAADAAPPAGPAAVPRPPAR